jgi:hypothetical protein
MIETFKTFLADILKKQGPSFFILTCVVWFFYNEVQSVKKEFTDCNNTLIELYSKQSLENREVIIKNTQVIEDIKFLIKNK